MGWESVAGAMDQERSKTAFRDVDASQGQVPPPPGPWVA